MFVEKKKSRTSSLTSHAAGKERSRAGGGYGVITSNYLV